MHTFFKLSVLLFLIPICVLGQDSEIDRLIHGELKMVFPAIYFKHNSTDYAPMPYTIDSCSKYIALHIKDINDLVIWRDSLETEELTKQRIRKLKTALSKHKETRNVTIKSMGERQKISRETMKMSTDSAQVKYLLSLNSVFEIAQTRLLDKKSPNHQNRWELPCWMNMHLNKAGRKRCKMERRAMNTQGQVKQ